MVGRNSEMWTTAVRRTTWQTFRVRAQTKVCENFGTLELVTLVHQNRDGRTDTLSPEGRADTESRDGHTRAQGIS